MNFQEQWPVPPPNAPRGSRSIVTQFGWGFITPDGRHFISYPNRPQHPAQLLPQWPPWPGQQQWPPFPVGGQAFPGMGMPPGFGMPPQFPGGAPRPAGERPHKRLRQAPQRLKSSDLEEDAKECPICYRDYYTGDAENEMETPVKIQCGHVYGSKCLDKWIQENDSCPTCRAKLDIVFDQAGGR